MFGFGGTPKQGNVKELNEDSEFDSELSSAGDKLVVVDFSATWCGPCQQIAPEFARLSEEYTNVVFLKVDVDKLKELAARCGVSAMPTFHFYKKRNKIEELRGANVSELQRLIKEHATQPAFSGQGRTLGSAPPGFQPSFMQPQSPKPKQEETQNKAQQQASPPKQEPEQEQEQEPEPEPMDTDVNTTDKIVSEDDPEGKEPKVDEEQLEQLLAMDFARVRAVKALYHSNNSGVEAAINWLMDHQEDEDIDKPLKIKELTPEEKAQKEREAREKAKRIQREARQKIREKEKKAELEREKRRRREGKQIGETKKEIEDIKRKKEMEERKRQRMEDKRARARIKALLEQDKKERMARKNSNNNESSTNSTAAASTSKPAPKPAAARNQDKCVIQFRLFDGSTCRNRFKPEDTIPDVFEWLKQNKNVYNASLTLPGENRTFTPNDNITLREADLVPRAQLTLTKPM